jgi:hypothetical protein
MECTTAKSNIEATAGIVREASFKEKQHLSNEEIINQFLDRILDFKQLIRNKVSEIESFIDKLESLTWYDFKSLDQETLKKVNDVISGTKDWATSLVRNYSNCFKALDGKVTIEELEEWKNAIDDLEEAALDLEKAAFIYPNDDDINAITEELQTM